MIILLLIDSGLIVKLTFVLTVFFFFLSLAFAFLLNKYTLFILRVGSGACLKILTSLYYLDNSFLFF